MHVSECASFARSDSPETNFFVYPRAMSTPNIDRQATTVLKTNLPNRTRKRPGHPDCVRAEHRGSFFAMGPHGGLVSVTPELSKLDHSLHKSNTSKKDTMPGTLNTHSQQSFDKQPSACQENSFAHTFRGRCGPRAKVPSTLARSGPGFGSLGPGFLPSSHGHLG
jgi:hypothetical protein